MPEPWYRAPVTVRSCTPLARISELSFIYEVRSGKWFVNGVIKGVSS